jgi:hypothetical protein
LLLAIRLQDDFPGLSRVTGGHDPPANHYIFATLAAPLKHLAEFHLGPTPGGVLSQIAIPVFVWRVGNISGDNGFCISIVAVSCEVAI